jgi:L-malate glycosyltransferase
VVQTRQLFFGFADSMGNKHAEKLKIALVAPSMKNVGGQSIQAQRLLDRFSADQKIELVFVPNDPETVFQNVKFLRTIFASFKFWLLLLGAIPKTKIVHVFSSGTTSYIISTLPALFLAKLFGRKTILHYHTGEAEKHLRDWKLTAKPTIKMFDEIVVPSQFLVDVFARFNLRAKAIFNFVEGEKFVFRARRPLRPVFLSNRNFEPHYQVTDVLRAFRLIQDRYSDARLLIAGSGSQEKELKELAGELKLKNAEFLGKIENREMPKLYDHADIYLNSSVVDNMPLSIIESFASGTPVVSTDAGGIPYICEHGETALLARVGDYENLAREAVRLLEEEALGRKIIENARRECVKYLPETVGAHWLEIYQDLAK